MAQDIVAGDYLMFAFYNEHNLTQLLGDFERKFADENRMPVIPSYPEILSKISLFSRTPDWHKTVFLTKNQSMDVIPDYINKRLDYFSPHNHYSTFLIQQKKIDGYYKTFSNIHPMAAEFCNKLIKTILIAELDTYIEGTTADGLGIAHMDFKITYNQQDFNELIIHQIIHMLLFIDDYTAPQVDNSKKQHPVKTTATHKRGGNFFLLYVLFHSFCVGIEVLNYRFNFNALETPVHYHPKTSIAIKRCNEGFLVLNEYSALLSLKGKNLLNLYGDLLYQLNSEISHAI